MERREGPRLERSEVTSEPYSGLAAPSTCCIQRSLLGEDFERRSTLEFFNNIRPMRNCLAEGVSLMRSTDRILLTSFAVTAERPCHRPPPPRRR